MPLGRQLVTATLVGIGVFTLIRRIIQAKVPRRLLPNRLFLFRYENRPRYRGHTNYVGVAAIATIDPYSFEIERELVLHYWSVVTAATNGNKKWLFLYGNDASAAVAFVDANFNFKIVKSYPPFAITFPYQWAVVNGLGQLLMVGYGKAGVPVVGFGEVLEDGSFVEWWRTTLTDFPFPDGVKGLPYAHVLYSNDRTPGRGSTVQIFDVKHAQVLSSRRFDDPIDGMVVEGETVYLYFADPLRTTEMCVVNAGHQLVTVRRTQFDQDLMFTETFDKVVSTPGAHLCFTRQTLKGYGTIRTLGPDGFKVTAHVRDQDWLWFYYVEC